MASPEERFHNHYPDGPDPATHVRIGSMHNVFYVFNITFFLAVVALSIVWLLYRAARLHRFPVPFMHDADRSVSPARSKNTTPRWRQSETQEAAAVDVHADDLLLFRPMRTHWAGTLCYALCCLVSLQILALYLVFMVDYYAGCQLKSIDNLCFYGTHFLLGSYMNNGTAFFVVWCVSVFWYTGWVLCKGRVINWFRMPVPTRDATHVIVWSPETVEVVSLFVSPVVRYVRRLRAAITPAWARGSFKTVPVVTSPVSGRRYFVFEGLRFLLDGGAGSVAASSLASKPSSAAAAANGSKNSVIPDRALEKLAPDYVPPSAPGITHARYTVATSMADLHALAGGLTADTVERVRDMVGSNACPFRPASFRELLVDEFFSLFHVYQLVQYVLMFWFSYLFVATIMSTAVLISAAASMLLVHNAQVAVERVANVTSRVRVRRDGAWVDVDSADLVPGDVVKLGAGERVPCDVVVVDGTCVVDESSLTGESLPCIKSAAPNDATYLDVHYPPPRHTLFDGTIVRQAGKHADDAVTAVVIATGMATTKGDLLAAILFPARMVFKYDEELAVVIVILLAYSVLCFSLSIVFQGYAGTKSDWITKWIYATAITSQILSPLLPVALEVGQIHAMERLKKRGINCLQPKRIMISGKTRVQAFDKTGTLTKDGLDFIGFHPAAAAADGLTLLPATAVDPLAQVGLATCHSAEKCADVIVASEVEFKMFEATGWRFTSPDGATPVVLESPAGASYTVLQRNDFDNTRQTQSVVVQGPTGECDIFVKGSYEGIAPLCKGSSLPPSAAGVARQHALQGCYVLALATRSLGKSAAPPTPLKRDDVERDLDFLGLIVFRNEMRDDSPPTIAKLRDGNVRPVMITGDSPQCGAYIARACGMVPPGVPLMLGEYDNKQGAVVWSEMTACAEGGATPLTTTELMDKHGADLESGALELAVTGSAFKMLERTCRAAALLYYIRVFARVKPDGKIAVINNFIASGVVVGMCGDGGNDCGALRTAHTGVALSEAEASMVSPFTAKNKRVAAVEELLREGRAALHTSIGAYKFLIMYGLIFAVLKLACYLLGVIMCQAAYMLIEGVAIIVIPYAMTLALPAKKLGKIRPSHGLLSGLTVSSVLGMWIIHFAFTAGALFYMSASPGYVRWPAKEAVSSDWWTLGDNWESTVLFFCTLFQLTTSGVIFSFGSSFSRVVVRNWFLMLSWGAIFGLGVFLLLSGENYLTFVFHIASQQYNDDTPTSPTWKAYQAHGGAPSPGMSLRFRLGLFGILMTNLVVAAVWQKLVEAIGPLARLAHRVAPTPRAQFRL